jgi:hypothetical protein
MHTSRRVVDDAHRFAAAGPDTSHVYGACAPGWHSAASHEEALDDWVSFMQAQGIERVLCLMTGTQDGQSANLDRYEEAFGSDRVLHAPIPDHHLTSVAHLEDTILPFLAKAAAADEPVVVHCLSGLGRTGQVLAAWLVTYHDFEPAQALNTVEDMGRAPLEATTHGNATAKDLLYLLEALR